MAGISQIHFVPRISVVAAPRLVKRDTNFRPITTSKPSSEAHYTAQASTLRIFLSGTVSSHKRQKGVAWHVSSAPEKIHRR